MAINAQAGPSDISAYTKVRRVGTRLYESSQFPIPNGNPNGAAFGGCCIGQCVAAACHEAAPGLVVYAVAGSFLSAASLDSKISLKVVPARLTRVFNTFHVEAYQNIQGKERMIMLVLIDFQAKEENILFDYSKPPVGSYQTPPESLLDVKDEARKQVKAGIITQEVADNFLRVYPLFSAQFDMRLCPESLVSENWLGMIPSKKTSHDHKPIHEKTTTGWIKTFHKLSNVHEQAASIACMMDIGTTCVPLYHSHQFMADTAACSSLFFNLHFFTRDFKIDDWALLEQTTTAAGESRVFSEGNLFNREGKCMARMLQQGIIRPGKSMPFPAKL